MSHNEDDMLDPSECFDYSDGRVPEPPPPNLQMQLLEYAGFFNHRAMASGEMADQVEGAVGEQHVLVLRRLAAIDSAMCSALLSVSTMMGLQGSLVEEGAEELGKFAEQHAYRWN